MESYDKYGLSRKYVSYGFMFGIVAPAVGIALYFLISLVIIPLTASHPTTVPVTTVVAAGTLVATGATGATAATGIPITTSSSSSSYMPHIYAFISIILLLGIDVAVYRRFDVIYTNMFLYTYLAGYGIYGIYKLLLLIRNSFSTIRTNTYESFTDVNGMLQQVQQATQSLQKSLDSLSTASDDTCAVMKGIEQKYVDNATAPSGDGENPPTPAEAKELKAQALPAAIKKWNQEKQDWAAIHGQVPVVECFTDGSLSDLITANQELSDLLESAPVQRVVTQVKRLETSNLFAQKYMDELASKLSGESFDNPPPDPSPDDTIATSYKLIKRASDVQSKIQGILVSTTTLKRNYIAMNKQANDPNTVNKLAEKNV